MRATIIQRTASPSICVSAHAPIGTPIRLPSSMLPTSRRSAWRQPFGISGAAATKSITSSSGEASFAPMMLLASGMKISAEPKPENPRARPATNADPTRKNIEADVNDSKPSAGIFMQTPTSLRGAKRRSNPEGRKYRTGLLRRKCSSQ
jgi:hypothetical protein